MSQQEVRTIDNNAQVLFETVLTESTQNASIFLQAKFNGKFNNFCNRSWCICTQYPQSQHDHFFTIFKLTQQSPMVILSCIMKKTQIQSQSKKSQEQQRKLRKSLSPPTKLNSIKRRKERKNRKKHPMHYSFFCLHMNVHKSTL